MTQPHEKDVSVTAPASETSVEGNGKTVLLVEDDATLRLMLRNVLDMQGYTVLEADTRSAALERLREAPETGVMILDLGLPPKAHTTTEGLAVIRRLSGEIPAIKIIVLTGQDEERSALQAIREGAFDFLAKPARSEDILSAVSRAFLFHRKEQDMLAGGVARLQINTPVSGGLKAVREEATEKLVRRVLKETGFNVYQAAARLGIKRESVYYFLKKFEISRDDG